MPIELASQTSERGPEGGRDRVGALNLGDRFINLIQPLAQHLQ